ncbi:MAG: YigZ family protein [Deltaproteobacteria bacterium]|nr:YigZ family protein [Deltaproteobacteria bacterium]
MEARYPVLAGPWEAELEIQGSRFIAQLAVAATEAEAHAFVAEVKAAYADATHNCWAFVAGPPGSTRAVGFSDDGEPHNTAGRPMLNVLLHSGVGDVVAVVTRYFGGTKLGRGGLVRAYGGAVQEALRDAPLAEKVDWVPLEVTLDYALVGAVERLYPSFEARVDEQAYEAAVVHRIRVPRPQRAALEKALADASRGGIRIRALE